MRLGGGELFGYAQKCFWVKNPGTLLFSFLSQNPILYDLKFFFGIVFVFLCLFFQISYNKFYLTFYCFLSSICCRVTTAIKSSQNNSISAKYFVLEKNLETKLNFFKKNKISWKYFDSCFHEIGLLLFRKSSPQAKKGIHR